jgi:hypothetical protein
VWGLSPGPAIRAFCIFVINWPEGIRHILLDNKAVVADVWGCEQPLQ